MIKTVLTAATLALSPLAALAATVNVSTNFATPTTATLSSTSSPYSIDINTDMDQGAFSQVFTFTAAEDLVVLTTATANRFSEFNGQKVFWSSAPTETLNGLSSLDELVVHMNAGETLDLTIAWDGVSSDRQDFDIKLTVEPVPLPAGVVLMGSALAGLGLARRRKG